MEPEAQPTEVQPPDVQPPTEILPGFWQAGTPVDWDWVRSVGFELVIDVNDADQVHEPDDVAGLRYVKHPLHDQGELPDVHLLDELVGLVVEAVRSNRPVLVHCGFGKNRSGLVVTLAVRELLGVDGRTALAHVRKIRHRAVNNETFAAYLESLPAPELIGGPMGGATGG
jgi:hypothetical protein